MPLQANSAAPLSAIELRNVVETGTLLTKSLCCTREINRSCNQVLLADATPLIVYLQGGELDLTAWNLTRAVVRFGDDLRATFTDTAFR